MARPFPLPFAKLAVLAIAASVAVVTLSAPAQAETRHHISLGLGYTKHLSDDLKDDSLEVDFTSALSGGIEYRYSMTSRFDLAIDSYATMSSENVDGVDLTLTNTFFGPGVRWVPTDASPRPFLQANVFYVTERIEAEESGIKVSDSTGGAGFGLIGGVDIPLSPLLSLPLTLHYLYGKPGDDVSGFGFNAAIAFNFGEKL